MGFHSGHRVDFRSDVSDRFNIGLCDCIGFYIIDNTFLMSGNILQGQINI